jgi:hypothetical protein
MTTTEPCVDATLRRFAEYLADQFLRDGEWTDEQYGEDFSAWWGNCTALNIAAAMLLGHKVEDIAIAGGPREAWEGTGLYGRAENLFGHDFVVVVDRFIDLWATVYCGDSPPVFFKWSATAADYPDLATLKVRPVSADWTFWTDYAATVIQQFKDHSPASHTPG